MRVIPQIKNLRQEQLGARTFWAADLQVGTLTIPVDRRFGSWHAESGAKVVIAEVAAMLAGAVRQAERKIRRAS